MWRRRASQAQWYDLAPFGERLATSHASPLTKMRLSTIRRVTTSSSTVGERLQGTEADRVRHGSCGRCGAFGHAGEASDAREVTRLGHAAHEGAGERARVHLHRATDEIHRVRPTEPLERHAS